MNPRQVMPRRLRNSRLVGKPFDSIEETVRWHGAMQGQEYPHAKWCVRQRTRSVTSDSIEKRSRRVPILRTHLLRPTWHLVTRDDIRWPWP